MRARASLPSLLLNVPTILHGSPADVKLLLGTPDSTSAVQVGQHPSHTYRQGAIQVVFVGGKASWIKLYKANGLAFGPDALPRLGLPRKKPTYVHRRHVMSWTNLHGLREVSLYADGAGGVSSALICVAPTERKASAEAPARSWLSSTRFRVPFVKPA